MMKAQLDLQQEMIKRKLISVNPKYNEIAKPKYHTIM